MSCVTAVLQYITVVNSEAWLIHVIMARFSRQ